MLSRHTKRAILGFLFAGTAIVLIGAATRNYLSQRALDRRIEQERAEMTPPEPLLSTVERTTRSRVRTFGIRLEPFQQSSVAAEVSGKIIESKIETGDFVEKEDLLFRIDPTLARLRTAAAKSALDAAKVRLADTERRVREAENLAEALTIPRTQLEAVRAEAKIEAAELARLQSELDQQKELLKRHEIRAPFSGQINRRLVEIGDSVNVHQPVADLVSLDRLKLRFYVSDLEVGAFQQGKSIPLEIDAVPEKEFETTIRSVANAADPNRKLFLIEGEVENPDLILKAGANGKIKTTISTYENLLFIPAAAVRFEGNQAVVEVRKDNVQQIQRVELGPEIDGFYPVLNGLKEGGTLLIR